MREALSRKAASAVPAARRRDHQVAHCRRARRFADAIPGDDRDPVDS